MDFLLLLVVALSLSADSFAVSIGLGAALCRLARRGVLFAVIVGAMHTLFVVCGALLSLGVVEYIAEYSGWIGFGMLVFLGVRMIVEKIKGRDEPTATVLCNANSLSIAVAVSLDAFVVGGALEFLGFSLPLWSVGVTIGMVTALSVLLGLIIGARIGNRYASWAQIAGGVVLILLGIKFLLF